MVKYEYVQKQTTRLGSDEDGEIEKRREEIELKYGFRLFRSPILLLTPTQTNKM